MAEAHSLYETMGLVRIVETDPEGRATLEYEAKREQCHSGGVVQGGFISGWIDAAMAHAAIAKNGPGIVPMTLELKVSFFAPTRPGLVIAEAWVERHGKRTSCELVPIDEGEAWIEGKHVIGRDLGADIADDTGWHQLA